MNKVIPTEKDLAEFDAWLDAITFVDGSGKLIPALLTADISDDPEGDRE